MERIASANLTSVRLVTEQMRNEAANKVSAGVAGGLLLGPLGLLAGAVIARGERSHLVILEHADGRAALLRCNSAELPRLLSLSVSSRRAAPTNLARDTQPLVDVATHTAQPSALRRFGALGWLALLMTPAVLITTHPLVTLTVSVAMIAAGVFVWRQPAFRQRFGRLRAVGLVAIGAFLLVPAVAYSIAGAPQHAAEVSSVPEPAPAIESTPPEPIEAFSGAETVNRSSDVDTRARTEVEAMGLAQAYAILHDNGTMRDWRSADQLNRTEVAYRLTEKMIMRGNVPRQRASYVELYRCMEAAYTADIAATPVEEIASACALTLGWLR